MKTIDERIYIGMKFNHYAKRNNSEYTVSDIIVSTSLTTGNVINVQYMIEQEYMGQKITDMVPASTIIRSISY